MGWGTIGPHTVESYSAEVQEQLRKKVEERELRHEREQQEMKKKDAEQRARVEQAINGIELELKDPDGWRSTVEKNQDPYGKCAIDYAECWAKLMQVEIGNGKIVAECYEYTQNDLGFFGITGFMFGCAVGVLSHTWKYGEELKDAHNSRYGVSNGAKGTVNPAVMTLTKLT